MVAESDSCESAQEEVVKNQRERETEEEKRIASKPEGGMRKERNKNKRKGRREETKEGK